MDTQRCHVWILRFIYSVHCIIMVRSIKWVAHVAVHGNNLGRNLISNGGQPLGVYQSSLAVANVFRNFHSMSSMGNMPAQNGLLWPPNDTSYLHHPEGWNESNLVASVSNLSLTNNIGSISSDSLPETTHAPTNADQVALTQANQVHGNDPNPTCRAPTKSYFRGTLPPLIPTTQSNGWTRMRSTIWTDRSTSTVGVVTPTMHCCESPH